MSSPAAHEEDDAIVVDLHDDSCQAVLSVDLGLVAPLGKYASTPLRKWAT